MRWSRSDKELSVLILSGSPIIGSFDFRARVDFVRVPGVIKLRNGEYTSLNLHIDIEETLQMRSLDHPSHRRHLRSRHLHRRQGAAGPARRGRGHARAAAGARRAADPRPARRDGRSRRCWRRNGSARTSCRRLRDLYDDIWVYGLPQICDPLDGVELPQIGAQAHDLHRLSAPHAAASTPLPPTPLQKIGGPYLLVTTGGGGDGEAVIDWVLRAYEHDQACRLPALLVLGPFMQSERQVEFLQPRRPAEEGRGDHLRRPARDPDGRAPPASSPWAATTRSARSCPSTSGP